MAINAALSIYDRALVALVYIQVHAPKSTSKTVHVYVTMGVSTIEAEEAVASSLNLQVIIYYNSI